MIPTRPTPLPVSLIDASGHARRFESLAACVEALGLPWLRAHLSLQHRTPDPYDPTDRSLVRVAAFVLRDFLGDPVPHTACVAACGALSRPFPARYRWRLAWHTWNRVGPVPYTGRPHHRRYSRAVRTFREIRDSVAVIVEDGEPPFRCARSRHHLRTRRDDPSVAAREDRNWKRHRRTQWRDGAGR